MDLYLENKNLGPVNVTSKTTIKELKDSLNQWSEINKLGPISINVVFSDKVQLDPIVFRTNEYDRVDFSHYKDVIKGGKIFITPRRGIAEEVTEGTPINQAIFPRDIIQSIAEKADDKTVLNLLATNSKFNDPAFFKRIFEKRYPNLLKFKKSNENLRQFYIEMVYYINKLKEEYGIDYLPKSPIFNPREIYIDITFDDDGDAKSWIAQNYAGYIASTGDFSALEQYLKEQYAKKGQKVQLSVILQKAAASGDVDFFKKVEKLIDRRPNITSFKYAVMSKNPEMINYIETSLRNDIGPFLFEMGLSGAIEVGDLDLVKKYYSLLEDKNQILRRAIPQYLTSSNNYEIFDYLYAKFPKGGKTGLIKELMRTLLERDDLPYFLYVFNALGKPKYLIPPKNVLKKGYLGDTLDYMAGNKILNYFYKK